MFTGIIEQQAKVEEIVQNQSNVHFRLTAPFQNELKIDQSVSHNGVCLTVTNIEENGYWVTAIHETLQRTNLSHWQVGSAVNVERCMPANGR
ncbi:MAG: riboflavin synthase, partial [Bacteroidota bacterium]